MPYLEWYITNGASFQSALAAVLAGFVFTSITVLISSPPKQDARYRPTVGTPIYLLLATCLSLIIASYIFAAIGGFSPDYSPSGIQDRSMRPYIAGIFGSCIFSLGVVMMLFSLVMLLRAYGPTEHLSDIGLVFDCGIIIVIVSVASTIVPPAVTLLGLQNVYVILYAVIGPLVGVLVVVAARVTPKRMDGREVGATGQDVTRSFLFVVSLTIPYAITTFYPGNFLTATGIGLKTQIGLIFLIAYAVIGMSYYLYRWRTLFPTSEGASGRR